MIKYFYQNQSYKLNCFNLTLFDIAFKKIEKCVCADINHKVLFTNCCRLQNFCPSLLRLVNNCVESIYKMEKTRTKVLPSAMLS